MFCFPTNWGQYSRCFKPLEKTVFRPTENIALPTITVKSNSNCAFVFWNQNRLSKCSNKERITMSGEHTCNNSSWTIRKGAKMVKCIYHNQRYISKLPPVFQKKFKHRKNWECCPVSLLIARKQRMSWIQVLNCQNSNQCLNCQKSL